MLDEAECLRWMESSKRTLESALLSKLEGSLKVGEKIMLDAKALDKLYVPTRYPNAWAEGVT